MEDNKVLNYRSQLFIPAFANNSLIHEKITV